MHDEIITHEAILDHFIRNLHHGPNVSADLIGFNSEVRSWEPQRVSLHYIIDQHWHLNLLRVGHTDGEKLDELSEWVRSGVTCSHCSSSRQFHELQQLVV